MITRAIFTLGLLELFIGFLVGVCQSWANHGIDGAQAIDLEVRVDLLLLTLPIPLVDLGKGNANLICKLLDQIVRPVRIFLVTDLKHGLLLLIESNARLLDLRLSTLFGHGILTNC